MRKMFLFFFVANGLMAFDLSQVPSEVLLNEVSRRMGSQIVGGANATYICDNSNLKISNIGEATKGSVSIYMGTYEKCMEQATPLNLFRSRIYSLTVIAICDSSYLKRYSLHPTGELKDVDSTYLGSYEKCFSQAKIINGQ